MGEDSRILLEDFGESNLEKYLSDVYTDEAAKDIERCDMNFIQAGVEFVLENLTGEILNRIKTEIHEEIETFKRHFPELKHIEDEPVSSISDTIVKLGSFYEEGVIGTPDDFHCVLIIGLFESDSDIYSHPHYPTLGQKAITKSMRNVLHMISAQHYDTGNEAKKKFFKQHFHFADKSTKQHIVLDKVDTNDLGRCKFRLMYSSRKNDEKFMKSINVTLTPAFRVNLSDTSDCVCPNSFMTGTANRSTPKELLNPKQILVSKGHVSLIENEHFFLKQVLSSKHKKTFTLLKHILKLNERIKPDACTDDKKRKSRAYHVTMYELKRCFVFHHYLCGNNSISGIGTCILDILRDIYDGDYFTEAHTVSMRKRTLKRLIKLMAILKPLETSSGKYEFDDVTKSIRSVEKRRNVVQTLRQARHDHDDSLQYFGCFILVMKYILVIGVGIVILYFMLHVIATPK